MNRNRTGSGIVIAHHNTVRFDAMRVFTRIVERRSFTKAADDFGLPRSSVTDAVQGLEPRLGVRLLQRTTRQVSPTLDGEAY
jgi:DNA-binding transcriptional LysR family regulator